MRASDLFIIGVGLCCVVLALFLMVMAIKEQNEEARACRASGGVPVLTADERHQCLRGAQ